MSQEEWLTTLKEDVRNIFSRALAVMCKCFKYVFNREEKPLLRPEGYEEAGHDTADYFEDDEEDPVDDEKYHKEIISDLTLEEKLSGVSTQNTQTYKKKTSSDKNKNMAVELKSISQENKNILQIIEHEEKLQKEELKLKDNSTPEKKQEESELNIEEKDDILNEANPLATEQLEKKDSFDEETMGDWKIAKEMFC